MYKIESRVKGSIVQCAIIVLAFLFQPSLFALHRFYVLPVAELDATRRADSTGPVAAAHSASPATTNIFTAA